MKIFAVYFNIKLTKKPDWFEEFRGKFQGTKILHVTLIQPRCIQEDEIPNIKLKIKEVIDAYTFRPEEKKMIFDTLESGQGADGKYVFMLFAKQNVTLSKFQKDLVKALESHSNYCDEINKEREVNFRPHVTIGVNISPEEHETVKGYFSSDYVCEGELEDLVLPTVKDRSIQEADDPRNLTGFSI